MRLFAKASLAAAINGLLLLAVIGLLVWGDWKQNTAYQAYDRANAVRNHVSAFGSLAMEAMQRPSERVAKQWANEIEKVRSSLAVPIAEGDEDAIQLDRLMTDLSHAFTEIVFRGQAVNPQLRRIQIGRLIAKLHQMSDLANRIVESSQTDREQASKMLKVSVWTAASLLLFGVPLLWFGFRRMALQPLDRLTKDVSEASLENPVRTDAWTGADEFSILGREFAEMQSRLRGAFDEVADKASRLETKTKDAQQAAALAQIAERRATEALDAMQQAQEQNVWAARHDSLTHLGNRTLLEEIAATFDVGDPGKPSILVMAIDLDRFKDVNDTYGHEAGDTVLQACGERLKSRIREERDVAFRIGGDEFVLCLEYSGSETHAQWYCDLLLDELLCPVDFKGIGLRVGASIGFSLLGPDEALSQALKRADLALYEAKYRGRNQAVAYSATLGAAHDAKLSLINDFKTALERDEITIELQPQVSAGDHHLTGVEILARWDHPVRGRQSPMVFLEIAEELKLQAELDRRVLDLALAARQAIVTELGFAPQISVNVSARRLTSIGLLEELRARNDLPEDGLVFEILETAFLDSVSSDLEATIDGLKQMGIKIEVDDFGTGHASFASVLALKPDGLKIDRMFVTGIDQSEDRQALLRGIIDMADRVSVPTIVEGVETLTEAQIVAELGAGALQGFAFAKPMVVDDFIDWALDWSRNVA